MNISVLERGRPAGFFGGASSAWSTSRHASLHQPQKTTLQKRHALPSCIQSSSTRGCGRLALRFVVAGPAGIQMPTRASRQPRLSAARGFSQLGTLRCRRWVFLACPHLFTSARVTTVRHSCHLPLLRSPKAEQMVLQKFPIDWLHPPKKQCTGILAIAGVLLNLTPTVKPQTLDQRP